MDRRPVATRRHIQQFRRPRGGPVGSGCACLDGARPAGVGRDAQHGRSRGKSRAGARLAADGARVPAEMNHDQTARTVAPEIAARFGRSVRLGVSAEARDPRFLTVVLRGALDGLATVAPVGDPDWLSLRGDNALTLDSKASALKLDDFFALNPAMPNLHRMFKANEAIVVHAAATSYRERSHFDGQDVLESGVEKPGAIRTGWLNRLLVGLAPEDRVGSNGGRAFAVGPIAPLVVRGPAPVLSWWPRRVLPASDDTILRLLDLYRHTDVNFARVLEGRTRLTAIALAGSMEQKPVDQIAGPDLAQLRAYFAEAVGTAARFLAQPDGPRVGALALNGWDTHYNEGIAAGWRNCSPPSMRR